QVGIDHFATIAHPTIKLFWASVLFDNSGSSPEILAFLRKALDSKSDAGVLREMSGPNFQAFRERVIRTYGIGRKTRVELVKKHDMEPLPPFGNGSGYKRSSARLTQGPALLAVRPVKQQGELIIRDLKTGKTSTRPIPQPAGFKPQFDFVSYFDDPVLTINKNGDLFILWTIGGNGDHGIAMLKKGADAFLVKRVKLELANCLVVPDPSGNWYLISGAPRCTVHRVTDELKLVAIGEFAGRGHHNTDVLDACFLSRNVLHLFWGDVLAGGNHLRMRCVDFDVTDKKWLHDREIYRLDKFVSSANRPTVLQLANGSLHYQWHVNEGERPSAASGLYYLAESENKQIKLANSYQNCAVRAGDHIISCYTLDNAPDKVFFRVISHGVPGPITEIVASKQALWTENLLLHFDGERIWFMNSLATQALYELKLSDSK
ncbi:MAG TPA: hypothetical protein VFE62_28810, partial [Gemmataceae bacterium]|nr:hypothetical protein [Gemmataceae bacterium]